MKGLLFCIAIFCTQLLCGQNQATAKLDRFMNDRQYYKALRYIDTLRQQKTEDTGLYYYLIKANEGLMRYNDAYHYGKLLYELDTTKRDSRLTIARLANLAGHKSEALRLYEQLALEDSLDFSVNYALGRLYQQNNRTGSALDVYMRQLSVDPSNVTLLTLVGDCFVDMKLISPAMSYYGKAFYEDMQNASLAIKATNLVLANKDYVPYYGDFLSRMLERAISKAPAFFPLRQTLGVLKYTDKQFPESEEIFTRLLGDGDSSRITLKYLGLVKFQQTNYKAALPFFIKAYPLYIGMNGEPTDIDLAMKYGEALCRTGSCSEALEIFEIVDNTVRPDSRFLSVLEMMKGMSYTYTMKKDKAIEAYWKAYKLNPENMGAIANLAYLSDRRGMSVNEEEPSEKEKKQILFAQLLFLQKVREKPNAGIDTQHGHSRQVLSEALDELFFKNENKMVVLDPDGKEYTYPVEKIRKLVRKE